MDRFNVGNLCAARRDAERFRSASLDFSQAKTHPAVSVARSTRIFLICIKCMRSAPFGAAVSPNADRI